TIILSDGTTIDGTAIQQGDKYWIKGKDGSTRTVPAADVSSITRNGVRVGGTGEPPKAAPATVAKPATGTPAATPAAGGGGANFQVTKRKADAVTAPLAAVTLWQKFVDENPTSADLAAAQKELDAWQKMATDGAEKINGKRVAGDERKKLLEKATKLTREGWEMMHANQTLQAMRKMEESLRLYPNSFRTNFALGYLNIMGDKNDVALRYLDAALRLNPKSAETLNNIGVAHMRMRHHVDSIGYLQKAAELGDSAPLVQNLVNGLASIPDVARNTPKLRPAVETAQLLASKYGIGGPTGMVTIVGLAPGAEKQSAEEESNRYAVSSGTGFIIQDDGLIVTNRHVVKGAKTIVVSINGERPKSAEIVVIDEEQDLALVKIKTVKTKLPVIRLAKADAPNDGAECTVLGFPLIDRLGAAIKITRGIVSSGSANNEGADVVIDAKVNPGNSGGPLVDKFGNVIGVVTMKSANSQFEDSYGMAISAGRVRKFLEKNNIKLAPADAPATPAGMSTEEIAAKVKPATVCIICTEREKE
ncbi:MAG TPA: trypsin-like peptidase domain-containing protein, partial [Tepidisphaeraceae bacterium]|nr:trypsin-like peptidase domain-containing protein [Tepidisphaeraceae bacterium]